MRSKNTQIKSPRGSKAKNQAQIESKKEGAIKEYEIPCMLGK
jgi:hypothetical protein